MHGSTAPRGPATPRPAANRGRTRPPAARSVPPASPPPWPPGH